MDSERVFVKDFSKKLINLRKNFGYSQRKLSELVGVSQCVLWKWEHCYHYPKGDNLLKLCKIFSVSPNYFLVNDKKPNTITVSSKWIYLSENEKDIVIKTAQNLIDIFYLNKNK